MDPPQAENISCSAELTPLHSCRMQEGGLIHRRPAGYNLRRIGVNDGSVSYLLIKWPDLILKNRLLN